MLTLNVVAVALATATLSVTTSRSALFKPLRSWLYSNAHFQIWKLSECSYCQAHWYAAAGTLALAYLGDVDSWVAGVIVWLAITMIAALIMGVSSKTFFIPQQIVAEIQEDLIRERKHSLSLEKTLQEIADS